MNSKFLQSDCQLCSYFLLISSISSPNRSSNSSSTLYQSRAIADGVSRSLDAASIEQLIQNCGIINLFRAESLEAGYILNILYNLDKMSDMKSEQSIDDLGDIETAFMNSFWEEIQKFRNEPEEGACAIPENAAKEIKPPKCEKQVDNSFLLQDLIGESDALLSMAFEQYISNTNDIAEQQAELSSDYVDDPINCHKIAKR